MSGGDISCALSFIVCVCFIKIVNCSDVHCVVFTIPVGVVSVL